MVDYIFSSRKQYWAALRNMQKKVNKPDKEGVQFRESFFSLTNDNRFKEKNWQTNWNKGKIISIPEMRSVFSSVKQDQTKKLKKQFNEMKKAYPNEKISWKEFKEIHSEPDYDSIKESYNSP